MHDRHYLASISCSPASPTASRRPLLAEMVRAESDRQGEAGRPGHLLHRPDRRAGGAADDGGVREEIRHQGELHARRQPGEQRQAAQRVSRPVACMSDVFGLTSGMEVLVDAGAVRQFTTANGDELPPQYRDPEPLLGRLAHLRHGARLQHQPGAGGAAAEELRRSAGAVLEGQDGLEDERHVRRRRASSATSSPAWARIAAWTICASSAASSIKMVNASARAILDQVIGGEYPMALQIFNHHAAISAEEGRSGRLGAAQPRHRQSGTARAAQECAASECRPALHRVHDSRRKASDLPEGELPAGAAGRAAADRPTSFRRRAASPPP